MSLSGLFEFLGQRIIHRDIRIFFFFYHRSIYFFLGVLFGFWARDGEAMYFFFLHAETLFMKKRCTAL